MGYFGETGTKVTWKNPQLVPEAQRQTGGWYYNPTSGSVDRWWNEGGGTTPATAQAVANTSETGSYTPKSFNDTLTSIAGKINEAYKPSTDVLQKGLETTEANILEREKLAREELPIIQQRYKTLLDELETKSLETQEEIKTTGNAAIGMATARSAASGFYGGSSEIGQLANIGALTAKTIRQAAGDYETNKQKYLSMQSQEELNIKKNILDIVSTGDEASLKLRQAIAAIGPEKLNTSITLAAQILAQDRAEAEMGIKFSEEARAESLFPLQKAKLSAEISKLGEKSETDKKVLAAQNLAKDVAGGMWLTPAQTKYAGQLSPEEITKIYQGATLNGPVWEPWAKEQLGTNKKLEAGDIKDGSEIGMTAGVKYQYTPYGWQAMTSTTK